MVGFGALNVDKLFKVDKIAVAEKESFIEETSESCGGSAANTAVGLARLGCKVGFIGKVAPDREGKLQVDCFKAEGVNTDGIIQAQSGSSGSVVGFVDRKGQRALYIDSGVNDTIDPKEIKLDYAAQTRFLHFTSFVGDKSLQAQIALLGTLPATVKVSFDPGSVYAEKGYKAVEPIIKRAFLFMPNSLELEALTGEKDYRKGAQFMLKQGVGIVAVKLGGKGCYITDSKEEYTIEPPQVKVVDTTGAGDAFCAGLLYGQLKGKSLRECGLLGNFVAAKKVAVMGARAGLPYLVDLAEVAT